MREDVTTVDLEQYFNAFADSGAMTEAGAFPTVGAGVYRLQVTKQEGRLKGERPIVHLTVSVQDDMGTRKLSTLFTDVAWIHSRNAEGKLDYEFKRYEQLTKALYPERSAVERAATSLGEVLSNALKYPIKGFVTERFKTPDGSGGVKWVNANNVEEAASYRKMGYPSMNGVANFSKFM